MKKLLLLTFLICISVVTFAQKTLTQEQYDALPDDVKHQIETVSNQPSKNSWGKEIGIAVNESLTAIEQSAVRIADSKIGSVATFLLIWKFCASNILGIFFAIVILIFGIWSYSRFWKKHVEVNKGLKTDGDYIFSFIYPLIIFAIMALALFAPGCSCC